MTALAFTAAALLAGLGAYYGTGAARRYLRHREDIRYQVQLAAERRRAEERAGRAAAELDKPRSDLPPRPRRMQAGPSPSALFDPRLDPCGAPPVGRQP